MHYFDNFMQYKYTWYGASCSSYYQFPTFITVQGTLKLSNISNLMLKEICLCLHHGVNCSGESTLVKPGDALIFSLCEIKGETSDWPELPCIDNIKDSEPYTCPITVDIPER